MHTRLSVDGLLFVVGAGLLNALIGQAVHEHGDTLQRHTVG